MSRECEVRRWKSVSIDGQISYPSGWSENHAQKNLFLWRSSGRKKRHRPELPAQGLRAKRTERPGETDVAGRVCCGAQELGAQRTKTSVAGVEARRAGGCGDRDETVPRIAIPPACPSWDVEKMIATRSSWVVQPQPKRSRRAPPASVHWKRNICAAIGRSDGRRTRRRERECFVHRMPGVFYIPHPHVRVCTSSRTDVARCSSSGRVVSSVAQPGVPAVANRGGRRSRAISAPRSQTCGSRFYAEAVRAPLVRSPTALGLAGSGRPQVMVSGSSLCRDATQERRFK